MAHFTRTQTTATWTVGGAGNYVTLRADWQSLMDKVFGSLNGDEGGCWAPSSPIAIDTAGLLVTGPAVVDFGGTLKSLSAPGFILANSDYPHLDVAHVGRTRTLRSDLLARVSGRKRYHWLVHQQYYGSIQSIACTINGASGLEQPMMAFALRVHNGARLTSATLTFRIPQPRVSAPKATPRIRIIRSDRDGNITPLRSKTSGADKDGYVSLPTPTSGSAWYAGGEAQTFEYACDQNNVIDTSSYTYFAQIIEEVGTAVVLPAIGPAAADGTIVRERKTGVKKVYVATDGNRTQSGVPGGLSANDSVLLTSQTDPAQNGIWVVAAGLWTRRFDLDDPTEFAPSFFIVDTTTSETWELVSPYVPQTFTISKLTTDIGGAAIAFQRRLGRGNLYHAFQCHFDGIVDMRPQ